jgi:hypothetical protein
MEIRSSAPRGRLVLLASVGVLVVVALLFFRGARESDGRPGHGDVGAILPPAGRSTQPASAPSPAPGTSGSPGTPTADPVLVGAGDIGTCASGGDKQTAALLRGIDGTVFTAGDLAYDRGTAAQYRDCYDPAWGPFKDRTRPAPGNHDWVSGLDPYLAYWGDRAVGPTGDPWYSFDLGAWHIVMLDSDCGKVGGCGAGSKEGRWLAADLASDQAKCTAAIFHHPRFSSGQHGDDTEVGPFWEALHASGADVVINGHDHDYERFAPQAPDGSADSAGGITEFVVGTGGVPLRGFESPQPNSEVRISDTNGVLRLVLHPGGYDWAFIGVDGRTRDSGSAACP